MIVECPSCHTRYRTDVAGVVDETTFFECSRSDCGHVFQFAPPLVQVDRLPESDPAPETAPADEPAFTPAGTGSPADTFSTRLPADDSAAGFSDSSGSFGSFDSSDEEDDDDWSNSLSLDTTPPNTTLPEAPPPDVIPNTASEVADAPGSAQPVAPARFTPAAPPALDTLPPVVAPYSGAPRVPEHDRPSRPAPAARGPSLSSRFLMLLLGLTVAGYAGFTLVAASYIERTAAVFSSLPVLGPLFDAERPSARHIVLTKMQGRFWQTRDGQQVFAIAGRAVNQAAASAQRIQIEGTLLGGSGAVLEQRHIFCGTETAPEVLESLTRRQVLILQGLMPPRQFQVAAGEGVDFLIAFINPPAQIVEFSSRVVSARFGQPF